MGIEFFYLVKYVCVWFAGTSRCSLIDVCNSGTEFTFKNLPSTHYTKSLIKVIQNMGQGVTSCNDALALRAGVCGKLERNKF